MLNEKEVQRIKNKYPIGTKIKLHRMFAAQAIPSGTKIKFKYWKDKLIIMNSKKM